MLRVISSRQRDIAVILFPETFLQLCEALLKRAGHHKRLLSNNSFLGGTAFKLLLSPKRSSAGNQRRSLMTIDHLYHLAPACQQRLIGSQIDSGFKDRIERAIELAARAISIAARQTVLASLNVLPGSLQNSLGRHPRSGVLSLGSRSRWNQCGQNHGANNSSDHLPNFPRPIARSIRERVP